MRGCSFFGNLEQPNISVRFILSQAGTEITVATEEVSQVVFWQWKQRKKMVSFFLGCGRLESAVQFAT